MIEQALYDANLSPTLLWGMSKSFVSYLFFFIFLILTFYLWSCSDEACVGIDQIILQEEKNELHLGG